MLRRVQESIGTPGFGKTAGKRTRTDKWLVKLEMPQQLWTVLDAPADTPQLEDGIDTVTGEIDDGWDDDDPDMPEAPPEPSPIAEPKHHAKWGTYWKRGKALGITGPVMDTIAGGITIAALTVRADALKEAIAQREADIAAAKD